MEIMTNTNNTPTLSNNQTGTRQGVASYTGNIDDYYMVDYFDEDLGRMVHAPFRTIEQVAEIASSISRGREVKEFRVLPEKWLSQLYNEENNSCTKDRITNRYRIFGSCYEELAECFTGEESLMNK
jgi:hypothetical protein